jgi:hypothetical protein
MPLIRDGYSETKLKSLPFGNDRPYGGSSNQPYIQDPIDVNFGIEQGSVGDNILGSDFLLRGGVLGAASAASNDVVRIFKFFNPISRGASFNGALFILKQNILERQNVNVVDGRSRTYFPQNTLAQVAVNAFGGHLDRTGLIPFKAGYYGDGDTGYYPVTKENDTKQFSDGTHNRLQLLYQIKRVGNDSADVKELKRQLKLRNSLNSSRGVGGAFLGTVGLLGLTGALITGAPTGQILTTAGIGLIGAALLFKLPKVEVDAKLAASLYGITGPEDDENLISYIGGPGLNIGINKTRMKIWNKLAFQNTPQDSGTVITKNEDQIDNPDLYLVPTDGSIVTVDFNNANSPLPILRESSKGFNSSKTTFTRKRSGTDYIVNPNLSISSDQVIQPDGDIIKFHFELINNDNGKNTHVPLRAYIDDFSDSFSGEWDAYKYMGRAENFYKYKGFTRDFSLSFTVPTLSRTDLITNYQKLNALSWLTMPDYSLNGYIRGNLAFFTMGDYFSKAAIVMKSISFTPIMEMGFDINRSDNPTEEFSLFKVGDPLYTGQLPKGIKVQCNIIPLTQMTGVLTDPANPTAPGKELFYTPQRGEAFIGNRVHVIKDRPDIIGKQYIGEEYQVDENNEAVLDTAGNPIPIGAVYNANNPEKSPIFTYQIS